MIQRRAVNDFAWLQLQHQIVEVVLFEELGAVAPDVSPMRVDRLGGTDTPLLKCLISRFEILGQGLVGIGSLGSLGKEKMEWVEGVRGKLGSLLVLIA